MTYWSTSHARLLAEPEFIAAIGQSVQAAAPAGAVGAKICFSFAGTATKYTLTYFGQVPPTPVPAPTVALELARDLRMGRYQAGYDAALAVEITLSAAPTTVRYDHGEMGPIDAGLIFDPDSYRDDLLRYPRTAPQWLIDYVGGIPLAQLLSGVYFPFPGPGSVPSRATDPASAVAIALDFVRLRRVDFTGHNLYSLTAQRIQAGWRVFTQAPADPARAGGQMRLIFLVADDGVVEVPTLAMTPDANELAFTQRAFERAHQASRAHLAPTPVQYGGLAVANRGEPESTADVPGAREAQTARDNLWRSVGEVHEALLAPLDAGGLLWPGGTRAYRAVRRDRTTLLATDGMSAPSLTGGGTSTGYGPVPGGSITGLGAEFFLESVEPGLRSDESAREHWLFGLLSAIAERAATDGSDFVGAITAAPEAVYVELPGINGPREWLVNGTAGVLLSNKGWGAPSGFDTPLGHVALITVTVLRASESVTTSAWPAAAGEIFRQLNARRIGHYFDPERAAIY